jgi:hypothetical protein
MHVFWDSDVPHWMAVGGVFVDVGEAGGKGKGFLLNRIENLHDFFGLEDVPVRIGCWWGC